MLAANLAAGLAFRQRRPEGITKGSKYYLKVGCNEDFLLLHEVG
jgi:hypothetical protein